MDGSGVNPPDPAWAGETGRLVAAWRGARETPVIPAFVLCATFIGFGALTSQTGLSWLDTLFMSIFIFALPGQVVLVDEMARGASVVTAAIAVTATAARLLPMTVSLMPMIRDRQVPKWMEFAVAYFVAVTTWIEATRRCPSVPRRLRAAYILGIAGLLIVMTSTGAVIGFFLAASVPPVFSAALLFVMPVYFVCSMLSGTHSVIAAMPIILGLLLGPVFHLLLPSFDLVLTGLIGGTAGFFAMRHRGKTDRAP
jgi:predicted branched-subunit amino acid permease